MIEPLNLSKSFSIKSLLGSITSINADATLQKDDFY